MPQQVLHAVRGRPPAAQVLLLPGVSQQPADFEQAGFVELLQRYAPQVQLTLLTPVMAHLTDRDWIEQLRLRLAQTAPLPLWLGGISLGAFMALRYGAQYPSGFDGLCLIAPYLGSRIVAAELPRAAALAQWQRGLLQPDDDERRVWGYVKTLARPSPAVFLGLGREDRFADTQRLLAAALPPACTHTCPGGHDWPVWRQLWETFLRDTLLHAPTMDGASR